ncbi:hypothetical protein [Paucibacter soli]|uniref:hypothetical protein n=1 Tax=Paucibacter soli TaxID=3133433 RepID=UPI003094AE27
MNKTTAFALIAMMACSLPPAYAEDDAAASPAAAISRLSLAHQLVDGSPWRFETAHENTLHHFRISPEGRLQRQSAPDQPWKNLTLDQDGQTASYSTIRGHTITFSLGENGKPRAAHSKHASTFSSAR